MELQHSAEDFLGLTQQQIVETLRDTDSATQYFRELIRSVYEDDTLTNQRILLFEETVDNNVQVSPEMLKQYGALLKSIKYNQGTEAVNTNTDNALRQIQDTARREVAERRARLLDGISMELQAILKVRWALQEALMTIPSPIYYRENEEAYQELRDIVIAMEDGDLAYSTYDWVKNEPVVLQTMNYLKFLRNLRFSPELQIAIATGEDQYKIADLASNRYLTPDAQVVLFELVETKARFNIVSNIHANSDDLLQRIFDLDGDEGDSIRMIFGFTDRDLTPEVIERAKDYPKLDLIIRAKTDSEAEIEMINQAKDNQDEKWLRLIARKSKLHTEEAVRTIHRIVAKDPFKLISFKYNPNLAKHPNLIHELALEKDKS